MASNSSRDDLFMKNRGIVDLTGDDDGENKELELTVEKVEVGDPLEPQKQVDPVLKLLQDMRKEKERERELLREEEKKKERERELLREKEKEDRRREKEQEKDELRPAFWGLINPQWNLCNKGRRQSPINVEPGKLLYDPYLRHIHIDKHKVSGMLHNTGQSLVFRVDKDTKHHVNISGGPLAYRYQFEEIYIHYGRENHQGSEHRVHGYAFPAELQLYGFNAELYHNMSEAQHKSQGIVGISLMVQIGETPNPELRIITSTFSKVVYKGASTPIRHLSLHSLMPDTEHFMTYEGSTTHPGCWETTVWIILNKPIYITKQELYALRKLMQGPENNTKAPLGNNARPLQPLYHRTVRTNIDFNKQEGKTCQTMYKEMYYKANTWNEKELPYQV